MNSTNAWTTFEARLAESLGALEDKQYLIVGHPDDQYFVQFARIRRGLRSEAISNHYLAPRRQLGPDQERRLIELGWKAPTHAPEADPISPTGSPNWYQDWKRPVDWAMVAQVAGLTLREVYGAVDPDSLQYYGFEKDGGTLILPTLGLAREKKPAKRSTVKIEWLVQLKREVERSLLPWLECFAIRRLPNGELLTQTPRAQVTVHELENPFQLLLAAHLLHEVEPGPEVLEAINRHNAGLVVGRLFARDGAIVLDHALSAEPFVAEQFTRALLQMHELVERLAPELHEELGGVPIQPQP